MKDMEAQNDKAACSKEVDIVNSILWNNGRATEKGQDIVEGRSLKINNVNISDSDVELDLSKLSETTSSHNNVIQEDPDFDDDPDVIDDYIPRNPNCDGMGTRF